MMFLKELLAVLLSLASSCSGIKAGSQEGFIVGGATEVKDIATYPFMASLQWTCGKSHCGTTIINPLWLITSAFCHMDEGSSNLHPTHMFRIVAGTLENPNTPTMFCNDSIQVRFLDKVIMRDEHVILALMKLTSPLDFGSTVNAVTFPPKGDFSNLPWAGKICQVLGWGSTETLPSTPRLMEADLPVLSQEECRKEISLAEAKHKVSLCTKAAGKGGCAGDAGGPLVCKGVQVGILVSMTKHGCGNPGYMNVWTRLDLVRDWIEGKIKDN